MYFSLSINYDYNYKKYIHNGDDKMLKEIPIKRVSDIIDNAYIED